VLAANALFVSTACYLCGSNLRCVRVSCCTPSRT